MKYLLEAIFGKSQKRKLNTETWENPPYINHNNNQSNYSGYSDSNFADTGLTEWESMAIWDEDY